MSRLHEWKIKHKGMTMAERERSKCNLCSVNNLRNRKKKKDTDGTVDTNKE